MHRNWPLRKDLNQLCTIPPTQNQDNKIVRNVDTSWQGENINEQTN